MLRNLTKKKVILERSEVRSDLLGKAIGLMFSRKKEEALIFSNQEDQYVPLHMFFVFYAIDVLYLDQKKRVIEIKENFRPFTLYHPRHLARHIIELPAGTVRKKGINVWDRLDF